VEHALRTRVSRPRRRAGIGRPAPVSPLFGPKFVHGAWFDDFMALAAVERREWDRSKCPTCSRGVLLRRATTVRPGVIAQDGAARWCPGRTYRGGTKAW
jgi:hypothetical protein